MRARNCVELEFHTEEDLETWLYLNQLETNNDGLPTIFRVKKDDASAQKKSLRDVGSLLPKKLEDVKTTSKVRLEIVKKKDDDRKKVVSQATREKSKSEDVRRKDTRDTKKKETPRKIETEDVRRNGRAKFDSSRKPDPKTVKRKLSASANSEDVKDRKSSRKEPSKPLSERLAFPQRDEPRKRAPIVWGDDDEETVSKVQNNSGQFSFKITAKTAKKEPVKQPVKQPQKPTIDVKNSGGSKFKFVPTFSKPCSKSSDPREVQSTSSGISSKTTDESKILEDSTVTSSAACDIWHLFPIKKSPQVLQHVQNHAQRRQIEGRRTINETIVVNLTNPPPPSVLTLENLGVSLEGMEILRRLKGPGAVETQTSGGELLLGLKIAKGRGLFPVFEKWAELTR
uniref:Uncharacterized protein n=1 Tax=Caenorhabditis japonica TaxID=281687 RepID=A0A8R1HTG1_CAEJA